MDYILKLGRVMIRLISPEKLLVEESIIPFLCSDTSVHCDVMIEFSHYYHLAPNPDAGMAGEDLLLRYYYRDGGVICEARGGPKGPLSISASNRDYTAWTCYMNMADYDLPLTVGNLIRLVPLPMILQHQNAMLFHASQIAVNGRGILFTAPSGTGKSTQARLWRDHRDARIICNDRTLLQDGCAYGYPTDGSEPVYSAENYPLGAVVVLEQSPQNHIQRLKPGMALAKLMPQLVFHSWDAAARNKASDQLIDLIMRYPVYQLSCTLDEAAVACLENRLKLDGVIE